MLELNRYSEEAFCVDSLDIDKLKRAPGKIRKLVSSTTGEEFLRDVVPVRLGRRILWADVITGTFYNVFGVCQSSKELSLRVEATV